MKYQTMLTRYRNADGISDKKLTPDKAREHIINDRPQELSIEEMNALLAEGYDISDNYEGERVFLQDKFTEAEKNTRRALSERAYGAMAAYATEYIYADRPTTSERYPEELIMGDDPAENLKIQAAFQNPAEHKEETVQYIHGLLKKLQEPDCTAFLDSGPDDEQVVDNFRRIHEVSMILTNFENMQRLMKDAGITVESLGSDESKKQFTECQRLMDQYKLMTEGYNMLEERLGMISNPMYASVDVDDPAFQRVAFLNKYGYIDSFTEEKAKVAFFDMLSNGGDMQKDEVAFDLNIGSELLRRQDVEAKDLMYRTVEPDGTKGPGKPYSVKDSNGNIMEYLNESSDRSIELYDPANPEHSVVISGAQNRLYKDLVGGGRHFEQMEEPTAAPPAVKKPGLLKSFFNTITFGWAFKKDFKAYEDYTAVQKEYLADQHVYQKEKSHVDVNNLKYTIDTVSQMRQELDEQLKNGQEQPDRELHDLIAFIESRSGVEMPEDARANVTALYEKAKTARESLQKDCDSGRPVKAGSRAYDIAAYAYLKNAAMKGELNDSAYAAMGKDTFVNAMDMMARCSGKVRLLADRPYLADTVEEKLLTRDGEDELAADIDKSTSVVIKKELGKKKDLSKDDEALLQQVQEPLQEPTVYDLIEKSSSVSHFVPQAPQPKPAEKSLGGRSKTTDDLGLSF